MIQGGEPKGYTIVEVMIFLAVTALLFAAAISAVSGKQANVQFSQAVRDAQAKIDTVINQVASGFYPNPGTFTCTANEGTSTAPVTPVTPVLALTGVPQVQGASADCTFIGKVLQFTNGGGNEGAIKDNLFSVAARRFNGKSQDVTSLEDSLPIAVAPASAAASGTTPDVTDKASMTFGLKVTRITVPTNPVNSATGRYPAGSSGATYGSIAFFSSLPSFSNGSTNQGAAAQKVSIAGVPGTALTDDIYTPAAAINSIVDFSASGTYPAGRTAANVIRFNPANGIVVCLADQGDQRKAMITIGGGISESTTKLDIGGYDTGVCP